LAKLVIGLDLSGDSWKCVVASRGFKEKVRVESFVSFPPLPFPPLDFLSDFDEEPEREEAVLDWLDEIREVLDPVIKGSGDVVVGLPQDAVSLRVLELPFSQAAKISRVLPFEAESSLPFDSDDLVFDFYPLHHLDGHTRVLCACIKRERVSALLEHLKPLGLDPVILVPTTMTFHHLLGFLAPASDEGASRTAFLNIGESASQLSVVEGSRTIFATVMPVGTGLRDEAGEDEDTITPGLSEALTTTFKRQLHFLEGFSSEGAGCPPPLKRIVLLGEGASLSGLPEELTGALGVSVERFRLPEQSIPEGSEVLEERHPELAPALALVTQKAAPNSRPGLNFRKEEFAFRPERKAMIRKSVFPFILVLALFICLAVRMFVSGSSVNQQRQVIEKEMDDIFKANFPGVQVVDPARQLKAMMEEARARQVKYEELTYPSAMACLAEVSKAIPNSINVKLSSFEYRNDRVNLAGSTDKLEDPNEMKARLSQVPIFHNVKIDENREIKENEVRFKVSISLKKEPSP
jgi:general secretion pathway protein L